MRHVRQLRQVRQVRQLRQVCHVRQLRPVRQLRHVFAGWVLSLKLCCNFSQTRTCYHTRQVQRPCTNASSPAAGTQQLRRRQNTTPLLTNVQIASLMP